MVIHANNESSVTEAHHAEHALIPNNKRSDSKTRTVIVSKRSHRSRRIRSRYYHLEAVSLQKSPTAMSHHETVTVSAWGSASVRRRQLKAEKE